MSEHDLLKDVYKDFFGVESLDIKKESSNDEQKQVDMKKIFDDINSLYITDKSKDLLKKIIEYMRKYYEGIEKNYVNFSLILNINNKDTRDKINNILYNSSISYNYIDSRNKVSLSLYKIKDKDDFSNIGYLDLYDIKGLSLEARQKLDKIKPASVGQASRISGVSPADINVLLIYLQINKEKR